MDYGYLHISLGSIRRLVKMPVLVPAPAFLLFRGKCSKRIHVSPKPASRIFVVNRPTCIASTLVALLQMKGFSARFFTHSLEALTAHIQDAP